MEYPDLCLDSTDSTNLVARRLAGEGAPHGTGVVARTQTGGRGRLGRPWFSPPGKNLYCSYILRPAIAPADFPKLTLMAGVVVAEYLEHLTALAIGLKWPNDIFIGRRKCGGILSESSPLTGDAADRFVILGIGLNLNLQADDFPDELRSIATSLVIEGAAPVDALRVFGELRAEICAGVRQFEQKGFGIILRRWRTRDILAHKWTQWVTPAGNVVLGKSLGPDENGVLRVVDADGRLHEVHSGDVTLARGAGSS